MMGNQENARRDKSGVKKEHYRGSISKPEAIMRLILIIICGLLTTTVLAETVMIEASQDNTLYESEQGAVDCHGERRNCGARSGPG